MNSPFSYTFLVAVAMEVMEIQRSVVDGGVWAPDS